MTRGSPQGEVQVTLSDGRVLRLRSGLRALAVAELAAGVPLKTIMAAVSQDDGADRQVPMMYGAAIFFGCLSTHHPDLSFDDAFDLLSTDGDTIMKALNTAQSAGAMVPSATANPSKAPRGKTNGTGTRSILRGAKKG